VRAEEALRVSIPRLSVERGDKYYEEGRVSRITSDRGVIEATVIGSRPYSVALILGSDDHLIVDCECPFYERELEACKHIWALIRAASAQNLLPDHELVLEEGDFDDDDESPALRYRRTSQATWERFLQALGPAKHKAFPTRNAPDEIAYVINPSASSYALLLRILGRARRKNGEWGKWKPISLRLDDLQALDAFDRESIALLNHGYNVESSIVITPATTAWWIERLARAGRLVDVNMQPIGWDEGPPWTFRAEITSNASRYQISGSIERDGTTLPLDDVDSMANGILISGGRASRFDDGGRSDWLNALRVSGPIEVPHADGERFREALLRAPIAGIKLPEELGRAASFARASRWNPSPDAARCLHIAAA
jgi:hypothetical protein